MFEKGKPMTEQIKTVGDDFPNQLARAREYLEIYKSLGPARAFGAAMIEQTIREADQAAISGDVVAIVRSYQALKAIE